MAAPSTFSADAPGPIHAATMRMCMSAAIAAMLASVTDARFDDPDMTGAIAFNAMVGPVRVLLEGQAPAGYEAGLEEQLVRLLGAYFQTYRLPL